MEKESVAKIPQTGRKKFRFNFIDVILLVIIIAAVGVLGYIILSPGISLTGKAEESTIRYKIEISHLREVWSGNVEIGQTIVDATTMENIGTVVNVNVSDEKFPSVNRNTGELVYTSYPDYKTMIITVEATASKAEIGYDIGKTNIQIGPGIQFRLPNLSYEGDCKAIEVIEGANPAA